MAHVRHGTVTLVYGAKDQEHNDAVALKEFLEIVLMALAAIFADMIAPYDPYEIDVALQFAPQTWRTGLARTNSAGTCSRG